MQHNRLFWRKADLAKLEDALMRFDGRGKFEERRRRAKRIAKLTSTFTRSKPAVRASEPDEEQQELF